MTVDDFRRLAGVELIPATWDVDRDGDHVMLGAMYYCVTKDGKACWDGDLFVDECESVEHGKALCEAHREQEVASMFRAAPKPGDVTSVRLRFGGKLEPRPYVCDDDE